VSINFTWWGMTSARFLHCVTVSSSVVYTSWLLGQHCEMANIVSQLTSAYQFLALISDSCLYLILL
jgi:hypothetical protein